MTTGLGQDPLKLQLPPMTKAGRGFVDSPAPKKKIAKKPRPLTGEQLPFKPTEIYRKKDPEESEDEHEPEKEDPDFVLEDGIVKFVRYGSKEHPVPMDFQEFAPEKDLKDLENFTALIYGHRGSGKSVALRYLLYRTQKWFDVVYSFSETSHLQPKLFDYIPIQNQKDGFDTAFLEKLMYEQEADASRKIKNGHEDKIKRILVIFDDVISDPRIRSSRAYNAIHTKGRHLKMSAITLTQAIGGRDGIPKVVRDNCDLTITFHPQNKIDRDSIIDRYLSLEHVKMGDAILRNITFEKYVGLVTLNRIPARSYQEYIRVCRAPEKTPQYLIGSNDVEEVLSKDVIGRGTAYIHVNTQAYIEEGTDTITL